jgi:tetratricopeptide (TPR) repeat protein
MHTPNYYYIKLKYNRIQLVLWMCTFAIWNTGLAQEQDEIQIAKEYLLKGEKEKALTVFRTLAKGPENIPFIHSNYLAVLLDLAKYKDAENYLDHLIKSTPGQLLYRIDLGIVYYRAGEIQKADRYFHSLIRSSAEDVARLKSMSDYLAAHNLIDYATEALQEARRVTHNAILYALEMANLYRIQGKRDQMVEEYLNYVTQTPGSISYLKNSLQVLLGKPEELESLEKLLYEKVQQNATVEVYADLLIWVNLQQKNFYGAFVQARAYDKRFHKDASKTLEIAQIALNNKDYENADRSFSFVIKEFNNTPNYLPARLGIIQAREAKVKRKYPVNSDSVRYLIREYDSFIAGYPDNQNSYEAQLDEALLHAYYLNEQDSAIHKLDVLISNAAVPPYLKATAKLDLGDIYLLKEEPWESTLLYSQVEKSQRETPIGYDAKLRNAKLSYFKGEFKLAQEHLDILKQATTREIANDAMDLSMRIKENTAFDSTGTALKKFAAIELLLYQNKLQEALTAIATLKKEEGDDGSSGHTGSSTILDDVYWLEANLRMKKGEFDPAIALLQKIIDNYGDDILADDAYFLQGEIYEEQLHDKAKAMEIYRDFLNRFPGSVYAAEARKRFRELRGDFNEQPINN